MVYVVSVSCHVKGVSCRAVCGTDQQGGPGVYGGGVQAPASARLLGGRQVLLADHRAAAGEHDPPVGGHGAHALSGGGQLFACAYTSPHPPTHPHPSHPPNPSHPPHIPPTPPPPHYPVCSQNPLIRPALRPDRRWSYNNNNNENNNEELYYNRRSSHGHHGSKRHKLVQHALLWIARILSHTCHQHSYNHMRSASSAIAEIKIHSLF